MRWGNEVTISKEGRKLDEDLQRPRQKVEDGERWKEMNRDGIEDDIDQ